MSDCKDKGCGCRTVITKQGIQGIQGPVGPPGPRGLQGIQGETGANGADGANGTNGTNGTSFTYDFYNSSVITLNGAAAAGSSVNTFNVISLTNGKFHTVNYFIQLNVNGSIGDYLGVEIDLSAHLSNNVNTNYYNVASFDIPTVYSPPEIRRSIAPSSNKKITINAYELPANHTDQIVYVFGQISFYEQ